MLNIGICGNKTVEVTHENTAASWGSGELEVFATPAMIAYMENTCANSVKEFLEEGESTVGTLVNVKHLKATAVGKLVRIETKLCEIDRRRLVFEVKAYEGEALIGEGLHERFIINVERFMAKTQG